MKLKTQTIVGFVTGVAVGIIAVFIIYPALVTRPTFYSSIKIDGNTLKTLYNSNFSKLRLYFQVNSGTTHTDLLPQVYNSSGTLTSVPPGLVRVLSTGATISVSGDSFDCYLEHNQLPHHYLQLQTLVSIITSNPGGYFILNPVIYDAAHICYQIVPFKSDGSRIVTSVNPRALELDPSPPAPAY